MRKWFNKCMVLLILCTLIVGCSQASNTSDGQQYVNNQQMDVEESQDDMEGVAGGDYGIDEEMDYDVEDSDIPLESGNGLVNDSDENGSGQQDDQKTQTEADGSQAATQAEASTQKDAKKKEQKLVYTCNLSIETTSYKKTMGEIEDQIAKYSGIIESRNEYDRDTGWYRTGHEKTSGTMECTIVVKIPSENYQDFLNSLDGKGKMTSKSMDVTNITRNYYDTQTVIESLKIQEKRLLKMMDEAKTIEDMITVEKRLTEVQTQLNQYKNQLSLMDTQVAYSTVTMDISEVMEYKTETPGRKTNTFSERFINNLEDSWTGFLSFMEGLLFLAIRLLPFALILALVMYITRPLRRKMKIRRQEKKERKNRDRIDKGGRGEKKSRFIKKKSLPEEAAKLPEGTIEDNPGDNPKIPEEQIEHNPEESHDGEQLMREMESDPGTGQGEMESDPGTGQE
ncbi:MAG: DUF4349 domain-containing protein [Eubacterium sp.]|nr:DUF4349 domain-containing protein [Eubacterium sp.]